MNQGIDYYEPSVAENINVIRVLRSWNGLLKPPLRSQSICSHFSLHPHHYSSAYGVTPSSRINTGFYLLILPSLRDWQFIFTQKWSNDWYSPGVHLHSESILVGWKNTRDVCHWMSRWRMMFQRLCAITIGRVWRHQARAVRKIARRQWAGDRVQMPILYCLFLGHLNSY